MPRYLKANKRHECRLIFGENRHHSLQAAPVMTSFLIHEAAAVPADTGYGESCKNKVKKRLYRLYLLAL